MKPSEKEQILEGLRSSSSKEQERSWDALIERIAVLEDENSLLEKNYLITTHKVIEALMAIQQVAFAVIDGEKPIAGTLEATAKLGEIIDDMYATLSEDLDDHKERAR